MISRGENPLEYFPQVTFSPYMQSYCITNIKTKGENNLDTNEFKSTILNHQEGFLLSSGDENGDCSLSMSFNDVFFDSAEMLGEHWLTFKNKLDEKEEKGKIVSSIYSIGSTSINLEDVKSIKEYDGDYLIDRFSVQVRRMFAVELEDVCGTSTWITVGLL